MVFDFDVQVAHNFTPESRVRSVQTPAGQVARALHVGPVAQLSSAHTAIHHDWCRVNGHRMGAASQETCGN